MSQKTLEERIIRLADIIAIYNLQSRYQHYLCLFMDKEIVGLFAQKTPGVTMEAGDSGVFDGIEGVKRHFRAAEGTEMDLSEMIGMYFEHRASQPVIEVAGDGKTAKGVWFSPGIMASGQDNMQAWSWGKYQCDYVKEDGEWKIWHMKWYQTFESEYEKGWLYDQECKISTMRLPPIYPPDNPTTYHMPYDPYGINYIEPDPPDPYDSYEDASG